MDNKMICPICGAMAIKHSGPGSNRDTLLLGDEAALLKGCICFFSLEELEELLGRFEENLSVLLKERYPGMTLDNIRLEIQGLPVHSPLRIELGTKLSVSTRAREIVKKRREQKKEHEDLPSRAQEIYDKSVLGEKLNASEWLMSQAGPPPKKIIED